MRLVLGLAAIALLLPVAAQATNIPGLGDIPNGYFFSKDMTSVVVALWPVPEQKATPEPLAEFEIPRAYVFLTSHHSEKQYGELPAEIEARRIYIAMVYPDGAPYSIVLDQKNQAYATARREGKAEVDTPVAQLRPFLMTADIFASLPDAYGSAVFIPQDYEKYLGDYGSLTRHSTLGTSELYFGDAKDLIRKIRCPRNLENADPRHRCEYYTVLSSHLMAKVTFADFRVNGGIDFAEERVRAFRATICRYASCD